MKNYFYQVEFEDGRVIPGQLDQATGPECL